MTVPPRVSTWDAQRIHELDRGSRVEAWTCIATAPRRRWWRYSPQKWVDLTGRTSWECRAALVFS
jgi:hypothetical protein